MSNIKWWCHRSSCTVTRWIAVCCYWSYALTRNFPLDSSWPQAAPILFTLIACWCRYWWCRRVPGRYPYWRAALWRRWRPRMVARSSLYVCNPQGRCQAESIVILRNNPFAIGWWVWSGHPFWRRGWGTAGRCRHWMDRKVPIVEVLVVFLGQYGADVVDARTMVFLPDFCDLLGRLAFDEGHLHDFTQFSWAGVGEGHIEGHLFEQQHYYHLLSIIWVMFIYNR